ncbi:helix-turn-helix transcriptional regulator [Ruminiclostridium herbifermentans]|uniref:Helix-turn-helix transcriptional regulator n=1 Tax=Ruminiclostridium herbifermentans TaxID=2488810 RepID=A0A4U7JGX3_9FIRM|nr:helix-turn-helix transcriptional regulator [Ruminiclostridium herbifermentans]QNU67237.1 helix-turn-helix transcriptional regulator [Ruminiclostridium herbifermentans]
MLKLNLKQIRKRKRLTQSQFAEMLGISQNYLCELENGKSFPSGDKLEQLSLKLNIPVSKLIKNNLDESNEIIA